MLRPSPVVLLVLDGFGERDEAVDNAIKLARTPTLTALRSDYPHGTLSASGTDVGLPPGQMGSSEVGHLNLGTGRVASTDMSRIDQALRDGSFARQPALRDLLERVQEGDGRLHLLGLASDGGVHASLSHLLALIDIAREARVPVLVHAFLDGREVLPGTAPEYVATIERKLAGGVGSIATVSGRYWAMDRDRRWERTARAFRSIVAGEGPSATTPLEGIRSSYAAGVSDEFVEPFVVRGYSGIRNGDAALCFNYRPDRARQLTQALALPDVDGIVRSGTDAPFRNRYVSMTIYDEHYGLPAILGRLRYDKSLGEVVGNAGLRQFRCAESEKYAHVTYFFSGGGEAPFRGERRQRVDSRTDVSTYDERPEMNAEAVANAVCAAIDSSEYDFVLVNFANPDAVGHTGVLAAAVRAVEAVDRAIGAIVRQTRARGGALVITADHGNCELMRDAASGQPHTGHTMNPVPVIYVNDRERSVRIRAGGRLCDVAPTLLEVMGLPQPSEMTGQSLLVR